MNEMEKRGLTLSQIAALAGVSKTVVHDWNTGSTPHDLLAVGRLARALGLSLRELLLGEPEDEKAMAALEPGTPANGIAQFSDTEEEQVAEGVFRVSIHRIRLKSQK